MEQVKDLALSKLLQTLIGNVSFPTGRNPEKAVEVLRGYVDWYYSTKPYIHPTFYTDSDDGTQYLRAALRNAMRLVTWNYFHNFEEFGKWLAEHPDNWLACDGEIRYDLFLESYYEERRLEGHVAADPYIINRITKLKEAESSTYEKGGYHPDYNALWYREKGVCNECCEVMPVGEHGYTRLCKKCAVCLKGSSRKCPNPYCDQPEGHIKPQIGESKSDGTS